jgi:NAD(P)-dependent dehydrogenase (short-subunit alcohol dehydrogenase family)
MQTVLITGANRGIGLELARQLAVEGYFVWLGARDIEKGREAVARLKQQHPGIQAEAIRLDTSDAGSVQQCCALLESRLQALDVLVNNAGIRGPMPQTPSSVAVDDMKQVFETNFFGVIALTQALLPLLKRSALPRIVNVTSDLASLTQHCDPEWQYYTIKGAAYGPSKTALNAYTVALAYELKDAGFKVNCVNPGYTATDFNQFRGTRKVEDAAATLLRYVTLGPDGPTGGFFSEEGATPW